MKKIVFLLFIGVSQNLFAQLQSPGQFLGYNVGEHFTPHHRIVEYVKNVAAAAPATVKLQQYGVTNEGRPLLALFISSAENIASLEAIRRQNMNVVSGKATGSKVAVVWLSYNVHGNEPSSSEAAMVTLHALTNPANTQVRRWLQNTVVVIDPCLNPDGRDRYVAWYNSVVGKTYDAAPAAREHREPWPAGRTNHYNFDLNRDWAWQTQAESQQRLALYNQWLPQVHVDYHEQGYNEPYYFAPAAEPFHEVITKWQRDFQTTIGKAHAKYFDEAGWLYFTKERFDLLYPSYGDTYPIYNGAIGMTYEQGGIGAGLGILTDNGDTLTLADRVQHHHTTAMSTVEVTSGNATELLNQFAAYYKAANAGTGVYANYIIQVKPTDGQRISTLLQLLNRNGITYYSARGAALRGYSYQSGKEETFNLSATDLVVPSAQPKGALVKVLMEPLTRLTDSATYDITAWSVPYAYGLTAFATKSGVGGLTAYTEQKNTTTTDAVYGYVLPWAGTASVKAALQLAGKGVRLRVATAPFDADGQHYDRGAILILKTGNKARTDLWPTVRAVANEANIKLGAISSGFVSKGLDFGSSSVVPFKTRRVALFTGEGISSSAAGEVWHYFEQSLGYPVALLNVADAARINWTSYDVVIMPDGAYRFLTDKPAADAFKGWIAAGGKVVALEGGVQALSRLDWSIKQKKADDSDAKKTGDEQHLYADREREAISSSTPGSIYKVTLDSTHPLGYGYPGYYYTLKQDGAIYETFKEDGWNVGTLRKAKPVAGFVGSKLQPKLQNGLLFGVQEVGRGSVTYLTDDVLFRSFWEGGKLLFANAVFLVGQD